MTDAEKLKEWALRINASDKLLQRIEYLRALEARLEEEIAQLDEFNERRAIRKAEPDSFRRI